MRISPINQQNVSNFKLHNNSVNFKSVTKLPNNIKPEPSLGKAFSKLGNKVWKFSKSILLLATITLPMYLYNFSVATKKIHEEYPQVRPITKIFPTQEDAINYSIDRITEHLNSETPHEYSVHINNQKHRIISEALGKDSKVLNFAPFRQFYNKMTTPNYSYTALHGHPSGEDGSTNTFSFQDFKAFIDDDDCNIDYVTNGQGKYCKMTKTENYRKPTPIEIQELEKKYPHFFRAAWPNTKTIYNSNGDIIFKLTDYPGMHHYWDFTTEKFGIDYETTFGTFGPDNDIYENGYHEGFNEKEVVIK